MKLKIQHITWTIPNLIELEIIDSINKTPPECYDSIKQTEIDFLTDKFILNKKYLKYNIKIDQIISIRSSYIKNKMILNHPKLERSTKLIVKDYDSNKSVLTLSKKYDGSPLNILRIIFKKKYSKSLAKRFFSNPKLLKPKDFEQFELAKKHDTFALIYQANILEQANMFENDIGKILDKLNIKYRTQDELSSEQIKSHGHAFNTPDFLIESDFMINSKPIKWIDAKNYYGANIKFIKKNLLQQTQKYINSFGPGAIIYKLGFNEEYSEKDILFLSYDSFTTESTL